MEILCLNLLIFTYGKCESRKEKKLIANIKHIVVLVDKTSHSTKRSSNFHNFKKLWTSNVFVIL